MPESEGLEKKVDKNGKDLGLIARPNASPGFWLCVLLPLSYIVTNWRYPYSSLTFEYKMTTIVSFGLFLQSASLFSIIILVPKKVMTVVAAVLPGCFTTFLIYTCLGQHLTVAAFWGLSTNLFFSYVFYKLFKTLPRSFTLGEASIVVQGFVLFLLNGILQIPRFIEEPPKTDYSEMNAIMIMGLFSLCIYAWLLHTVKLLRHVFLFYPLSLVLVMAVCFSPVTSQLPIITLALFITNDLRRVYLIIFYIGLLGLTLATVSWRLDKSEKATTSVRKIFHILVVCVYIPGLLYQCTLLYIASGVALALLILLETIRVAAIPPLGEMLIKSVDAFIDEKDSAGIVALTPLYLLVGCSIPMWISPCPCTITDTIGDNFLPMLSGVMSIGIGDTAASVFGSRFGRFKWPKTQKSIQGTIASIIFQLLAVYGIHYFQYVTLTDIKIAIVVIAIVLNSVVEAFTDQVDNIVLPLIFYIVCAVI